MQYLLQDYSDYERLLYAFPQRGYQFMQSICLNEELRNNFFTTDNALRALFCGINEAGEAIYPSAYPISVLLNDKGYMHAAWVNYMTLLGYTWTDLTTFLQTNYALLLTDPDLCAAMLQDDYVMNLFFTDSTLWSAILANKAYFRRCMCSYAFCNKLAATPTKMADIRASSTALNAINTNKAVYTSSSSFTASASKVYFVMYIGCGGKGGSGGYSYSGSCCTHYNHGTAGSEGGTATAITGGGSGKTYYVQNSSYVQCDGGGGGGYGLVAYRAIRIMYRSKVSITVGVSTIPAISGQYTTGTLTYAANRTQEQILPDIATNYNGTSGTALTNGYGGYGYGSAASGNNFLGTLTGSAGGARTGSYGAAAGSGGQGVGAGGGGGGASSNNTAVAGGAGATSCLVLYKGA